MKQEISLIAGLMQQRGTLSITHIGSLLSMLGIVTACGVTLSSDAPVPIVRPLILALAPLVLLVRLNVESLAMLQQIVCFYLVAILFNEAHLRYISFVVLSRTVSVSVGVVPLAFCVLGYVFEKTESCDLSPSVGSRGAWCGWVAMAALVLAHAVVLILLLHRFYGYGYEHSLGALGHLSMYIVLFAVLHRRIAEPWFRYALGVLMAAFYAIYSIM